METCKCSFKHLLISHLLTSHWIKQVTWLDAERVGGHQRLWQSSWLQEGMRNWNNWCDHSTTPTVFFFCFLGKGRELIWLGIWLDLILEDHWQFFPLCLKNFHSVKFTFLWYMIPWFLLLKCIWHTILY